MLGILGSVQKVPKVDTSERTARIRAASGGASAAANTTVSARVLIVPRIARFPPESRAPP